MAENKKSFVLYSDLIHTVSKMPSDKAGDLFKHILAYVNDQNPTTEDLIVQLTFEPIKQQLKRDLTKYEVKREQWSEAGKRSAEVRASKKEQPLTTVEQPLTTVDSVATVLTVNDNVSVNVNDSVSVSDNVNAILLEKETKKDIRFNFRKNLSDFGIESGLVDDWLSVRKTKKATNTKTAFEIIESELLKCENELKVDRNTAIKYAIEKSWSGFKSDWIRNEQIKNQNNGNQQNGRISDEQRLNDIFIGGKYDHLM